MHPWCRDCLRVYAREKYEKRREVVTRKPRLPEGAPPQFYGKLPAYANEFLDRMFAKLPEQSRYKAYLIFNTNTNEAYIGITERSLEARWRQHVSEALRGKGYLLHQAIRQHGLNAFDFSFIACARSRSMLHDLEQQLVEQYDAVIAGYNQTRGGGAGESVGDKTVVGGLTFISFSAAARHFKISEDIARQRIKRYGWTIEQALEIAPAPLRTYDGFKYELRGVRYRTFSEACKAHGLTDSAVRCRLAKGWTQEEAFGLLPRKKEPKAPAITIAGVKYPGLAAATEAAGIPLSTVKKRLRGGYSLAQALGNESPPKRMVPGKAVTVGEQSYMSIAHACHQLGKDEKLVAGRLRNGWSIDEAFDIVKPPSKLGQNGLRIEVGGQIFASHALAAKAFGIDPRKLHKRQKAGWTLEQALGIKPPPERIGNGAKTVVLQGVEYPSMEAACAAYGRTVSTVGRRLRKGLSLEKAIATPARPRKPDGSG